MLSSSLSLDDGFKRVVLLGSLKTNLYMSDQETHQNYKNRHKESTASTGLCVILN